MKTIQDMGVSPYLALESLKGRKDPAAIKEVAREMESLFVQEMLKAMRDTVKPSSGDSGFGKDTYMGMFDMQLARVLSERGLGLQDLLVKSMSRQLEHEQPAGQDQKDHSSGQQKNYHQERQEQKVTPATGMKKETPDSVSGLARPSADSETAVSPAAETNYGMHFPVRGVISSGYGMRTHPIFHDRRFHRGIDIAAPEGTYIRPIAKGTVVFSGEKAGYGNMVIIDHGDGMTSQYAHNKINLVKKGDEVGQDTVIAEVGNEGLSTGPHVHLEVKRNGKTINPLSVLAMK
ncbi:MAG: peptidoglycan DD-metalloendopeptidase family protein [Nitrospiraceae bacterium]|nr:peptidoglycan DD-metalloendopeptidase family protein [Nitrospiraceae bacterium]